MADGTNNDADFAEQDRSEKNKEENKKLRAAIEQFDRDQEAFNESSSEFDDDRKNVDDLEAEETKKTMTGMLNESDDNLFQSSFDDVSVLDLENSENAADYVKEDLKKKSLQENQGTITKAEFKDQECSDRVEAEIPAKISELSPLVQGIDQKMSNSKRLSRELEEKQEELKKILGLTGDTEKEDSQRKIAVLEEELYKLTIELESDGESVNLDLNYLSEVQTRVDGITEEVVTKCLHQLEVLALAEDSINDLLKGPAHQELRDEIKSDMESTTQNTKAKMESRLNNQIGGGAEDSKKTTEEVI
ncbi:unnamed protein product [Ilex paraguariensis]|uniref:Uncharacterized protein n=1 Tax=Ilex paraguariensis TaxID=185542 RepID=A0ABC8T025_9AQUA